MSFDIEMKFICDKNGEHFSNVTVKVEDLVAGLAVEIHKVEDYFEDYEEEDKDYLYSIVQVTDFKINGAVTIEDSSSDDMDGLDDMTLIKKLTNSFLLSLLDPINTYLEEDSIVEFPRNVGGFFKVEEAEVLFKDNYMELGVDLELLKQVVN